MCECVSANRSGAAATKQRAPKTNESGITAAANEGQRQSGAAPKQAVSMWIGAKRRAAPRAERANEEQCQGGGQLTGHRSGAARAKAPEERSRSAIRK